MIETCPRAPSEQIDVERKKFQIFIYQIRSVRARFWRQSEIKFQVIDYNHPERTGLFNGIVVLLFLFTRYVFRINT